MKRLSIMGALASLALVTVSLLTPQAAQADVPPGCTVYDANAGYPQNSVYYCAGAAKADALTVVNSLAAKANGINELRTAYEAGSLVREAGSVLQGVPFFVFGTPLQYSTAIPSGQPPANMYSFGAVTFDASNRPTIVAVFKQDSESPAQLPASLGNWAAYYGSQASDALVGYIANGGVLLTPYANMSATAGFADYNTELTFDFTAFDALQKCHNSVNNTFGVFSHQADPTKLPTIAYICTGTTGQGDTLNAGYSGSNHAILQQIWPNAFGLGTPGYFAEEYGYRALSGDDSSQTPLSKDYYFQPAGLAGQFVCSKAFVDYVTTFGFLPTTAQLQSQPGASGCSAAIKAVYGAKKLFSNTPDPQNQFPDGRVFAGVSTTTGAQVQSKLENLGSLNGSVQNTGIKQTLTKANSAVYVFSGNPSFQSTFKAAGLTLTDPTGKIPITLAKQNGATFPIGMVPVWYSAINETSGENQSNAANVSYTTAHELGHTTDLNIGQPSAVPAKANQKNFDLAMQNDWLLLNFTDAAGKIQRGPCNLGPVQPGPFIGSNDPSQNGNPYCDGMGNLTPSEKKVYTNPDGTLFLNSKIFQIGIPELKFLSPGITIGNTPGVPVNPGWVEWFAQAFAVVSRADLGSTSNRPQIEQALVNGVFAGGYFGCTAGNSENNGGLYNGWLELVYSTGKNTTTASLPKACRTKLPTGYKEIH